MLSIEPGRSCPPLQPPTPGSLHCTLSLKVTCLFTHRGHRKHSGSKLAVLVLSLVSCRPTPLVEPSGRVVPACGFQPAGVMRTTKVLTHTQAHCAPSLQGFKVGASGKNQDGIPVFWRLEQEDCDFEGSQGCMARSCIKKPNEITIKSRWAK